MNGLVIGAASGLVATVPMSAAMAGLQRAIPEERHRTLPPHRITTKILRRLGLIKKPTTHQWEAATLAAHFGYGAAAGSAFGLIKDQFEKQSDVQAPDKGQHSTGTQETSRSLTIGTVEITWGDHLLRDTVAGMTFGCALWAGSYLGWLPALGVHPSATHETNSRNGLMIASHLVWGAALGALSSLHITRADSRTEPDWSGQPAGVQIPEWIDR